MPHVPECPAEPPTLSQSLCCPLPGSYTARRPINHHLVAFYSERKWCDSLSGEIWVAESSGELRRLHRHARLRVVRTNVGARNGDEKFEPSSTASLGGVSQLVLARCVGELFRFALVAR